MRTDNGGASWHRQTLPKLPSGDPFELYDGTAADEDHAWVVGTAGDGHTAKTSEVILATDDGGSHWRVQRCKEWAPTLTGVAFADAKVGWAIAPGWPNVVLSTVDGGITWKRLPFPANANADSICCVDRQHVWALSGPRRIYSSSDGGHSWRMSPTGLPDKFARTGGSWFDGAMQFLDAHHGWMTGGQDGSILSTQDGGLHWRLGLSARLTAPNGSHKLMLRAIHFADSRHGWVLGQSQTKADSVGLFAQTSDGGRSWEPVDLPSAAADEAWSLLALESVSPNRAWAVGVGLILPPGRVRLPPDRSCRGETDAVE